jgi:hypothetical protein
MSAFIDLYELALAEVAAGQLVPIPLFPLGEWKSAKYPSLPLTRELADELIANFEAGVLGTEPVLDSSGRHDTSAPAAGWFKRMYVAPTKDGLEMLFGDAELTDLGAEQLNAGLYKYDSIELGPVVDNATGLKTDNVFRSATLTNTPVLRMLPPVLDAADSIAMSEPVEILLSEIILATVKDPAQSILDDIDEDDGDPAESDHASSAVSSQAAKDDEGQPVTLAEGDAAPKGVDHMKSVALKLNLAEDADETIILAEVVKLADERDAAVAKIAAVEKAARDAEVEHLLAELVDGAHILPGQKEAWKKLADDAPDSFTVFAENAKKSKAIELGESGDGSQPVEESDDANTALAELAAKIAKDRDLELGAAMDVALAERPDLASRLYAI